MLAGRFMNLCVAAIQKDHRQRTALYVLQDILTTYPGTVSAAVRCRPGPDPHPTCDCVKTGDRHVGAMPHGYIANPVLLCMSLNSTDDRPVENPQHQQHATALVTLQCNSAVSVVV